MDDARHGQFAVRSGRRLFLAFLDGHGKPFEDVPRHEQSRQQRLDGVLRDIHRTGRSAR
jgi:hypothetical protein